MIPVRIKLPLNIRSGPGTGFGPIGVAPPSGKIVLMDGVKEDGIVHKGITKWYYKLNDKNVKQWYWGGRIEEVLTNSTAFQRPAPTSQSIFPASDPNSTWLNTLGIAEVWKVTKGEGVNVAILDTGIDLQNSEIKTKLFSQNISSCCRDLLNDDSDVSDKYGHGSHCASIISSENGRLKVGIAPNSRLFIGKISAFSEMQGYGMLTKGILWASNIKEVDIISISFGINDQGFSIQDLSKAVEYAVSKNKIIVAAIGNKHQNPKPVYPALFDNCISVGAYDLGYNEWEGNVETDKTFVYAPGVNIMSYVINNNLFRSDIFPMSGSSQATAVVAGVISLIISDLKKNKKNYNVELIKRIIKTNSRPLHSDNLKAAIDPFKIFAKLNQ